MSRIRRLARRRSLQWVAGGLVLLLALWLAVRIPAWRDRQAGIAEHAAVHQRLRDQGLDVTVADRLARLPALDPQRQAEAKRMLGCIPGTPNWQPGWMDQRLLSRPWSFLHRRKRDPWQETPPADVQALLQAAGPDLDALTALLAQGPVVVSSLAWCRDSVPDPDAAEVDVVTAVSFPKLDKSESFMNGFLLRAQVATDPGAAMTTARRLRDAYAQPGALIDGIIGIKLHALYDQGMLDLLQRRRLAETDFRTWVAEPPAQRTLIADAFAGERVFYAEAAFRTVVAGDDRKLDDLSIAFGNGSGGTGAIAAVTDWWEQQRFHQASWRLGPIDFAHYLRWLTGAEFAMRTGDVPPDATALLSELTAHGGIQARNIPILEEVVRRAQLRHESHRLCRAVGRVLWAWQQPGGALPADEAAFLALQPTTSCDQGPGASRIRYHRLDDHRFQVHLDPDATAPGWNLEERIREDLKRVRSRQLDTRIEIDLSDDRTPITDF